MEGAEEQGDAKRATQRAGMEDLTVVFPLPGIEAVLKFFVARG